MFECILIVVLCLLLSASWVALWVFWMFWGSAEKEVNGLKIAVLAKDMQIAEIRAEHYRANRQLQLKLDAFKELAGS